MLPVRTPRHRRTPTPSIPEESWCIQCAALTGISIPDNLERLGNVPSTIANGARLAHSQRSRPGRRALAASGQRPQRAGRRQQHRRRHLDGLRQIPHLPTLDPSTGWNPKRKGPPRWSSTPPRPWPTTRPGVGRNAARQSGWIQTPWGRSTETSRSHSGMW